MKTVVGLLEDYEEAEDLTEDLVDEGFNRASIDIVKSEAYPAGKGKKEKESGGFIQSLKKVFGAGEVPETDREYYSEGVRRGGVLVAVTTDDNKADSVVDIMNDHDAVDIEKRAEQWKETGWTGFDEKQPAFTPQEIARERETVLPVTEEKVKVGKREVARGGVRVYSRVIETPVEEKVSLREEHAKVERKPVDRPVAAGEEAFKETTIEIRERGEEPVVSKEARVKEEVVVGKQATERTETIHETARRTEVSVEDQDFRNDFASRYGTLGEKYETYDPAYRFASSYSGDKRYMNKNWSQVESDIHRDWEKKHPGTWDKFKDSIRYGWDRMTGRTTKKKAA